MNLINKDALVAEIERRKKRNVLNEGAFEEDIDILSFLDTLETKGVDLEKEIYDAEKTFGDIDEMGGYSILIFDDEFRDLLHHFFELGLNAQKRE